MKNRRITHARQQVHMYKDYYKPSFNLLRFGKAILGVLIFGSALVAHHYYSPARRRSGK
ncbi:MAG: hypothetical protein ABR502_01500 [Chitinophagaceae bacterium]